MIDNGVVLVAPNESLRIEGEVLVGSLVIEEEQFFVELETTPSENSHLRVEDENRKLERKESGEVFKS